MRKYVCIYCIHWTPQQILQNEIQKHISLFIGKREVRGIDKFKSIIKKFVTMNDPKGGN